MDNTNKTFTLSKQASCPGAKEKRYEFTVWGRDTMLVRESGDDAAAWKKPYQTPLGHARALWGRLVRDGFVRAK